MRGEGGGRRPVHHPGGSPGSVVFVMSPTFRLHALERSTEEGDRGTLMLLRVSSKITVPLFKGL